MKPNGQGLMSSGANAPDLIRCSRAVFPRLSLREGAQIVPTAVKINPEPAAGAVDKGDTVSTRLN